MSAHPLDEKLLLVFDFETTGLTLHPDAPLALQPRAIEFGSALIDCADGSVVERRTMLIHPGCSLTAEQSKLAGGITNEMLAHEGSFAERLEGTCMAPDGRGSVKSNKPGLRELFSRAAAMLSHNLPFDRAILAAELARLGVTDFPWPAQELCTVGLYKEHWGRNPKLIELYEHVLGRPLAQTHRAQDDVEALVEIVQAERLWELVA